MTSKVYTITFGDVAENHARMQKIGSLHANGYSKADLDRVRMKADAAGLETECVYLTSNLPKDLKLDASSPHDAYVLIIRKGVQHILEAESTKPLMDENDMLTMDKHALMRGRVVNKHARWNLCFADEDQEPNYEDGKGRIVSWRHIPLTQKIREKIAEWTEDEMLNGEANYYYDISKCGIGFHGDGERKKVFAARMGPFKEGVSTGSMALYYQWYKDSNAVGEAVKLELYDGDMYMMSEKAVGFDWLKKKIPTLRHATGCKKFTGH
jgi:hypothetical protein